MFSTRGRERCSDALWPGTDVVASNVMLLPLALQWHSELSADKPEKTCQGYNEASAAALAEAGAGVRRGTLDDLDVLRSVAAASDGVVHLRHDTGEPSRHSARRSRTVTGRSSSRPGFGVAAGRVATEHDEPAAQGSGGIDTRLGTARKIVALALRGCAPASCGCRRRCTAAGTAASFRFWWPARERKASQATSKMAATNGPPSIASMPHGCSGSPWRKRRREPCCMQTRADQRICGKYQSRRKRHHELQHDASYT